MAAVTIHSDFEAQENKICNCFHLLPFYLLLSDRTGCHDLRFLKTDLLINHFKFVLQIGHKAKTGTHEWVDKNYVSANKDL